MAHSVSWGPAIQFRMERKTFARRASVRVTGPCARRAYAPVAAPRTPRIRVGGLVTQERYVEEAGRERKGPLPADETARSQDAPDTRDVSEEDEEHAPEEQGDEHAEPRQPRPA